MSEMGDGDSDGEFFSNAPSPTPTTSNVSKHKVSYDYKFDASSDEEDKDSSKKATSNASKVEAPKQEEVMKAAPFLERALYNQPPINVSPSPNLPSTPPISNMAQSGVPNCYPSMGMSMHPMGGPMGNITGQMPMMGNMPNQMPMMMGNVPMCGNAPNQMPMGGNLPNQMPMGGNLSNQMPMGGNLPNQMPMGGNLPNQMPMGGNLPNQMPMGGNLPNQMPMGGNLPNQMPMGGNLQNQMPMGGNMPMMGGNMHNPMMGNMPMYMNNMMAGNMPMGMNMGPPYSMPMPGSYGCPNPMGPPNGGDYGMSGPPHSFQGPSSSLDRQMQMDSRGGGKKRGRWDNGPPSEDATITKPPVLNTNKNSNSSSSSKTSGFPAPSSSTSTARNRNFKRMKQTRVPPVRPGSPGWSSSPSQSPSPPPPSLDKTNPVFRNDGSFLERFKELEKSTVKTESPDDAKQTETKKPPVKFAQSMVGKRRGGRVLKTGVVEKLKKPETEDSNAPKDAWSLYMAEVKKYREINCEEEGKTRALVK